MLTRQGIGEGKKEEERGTQRSLASTERTQMS